MRRAKTEDRSIIEAALGARSVISMFPLSNLMRYGMDTDHSRGMSFWLGEGDTPDVLGITRDGAVMPSFSTSVPPTAAKALAGRRITGVIGAKSQVRPLVDALGIAGAKTELDADEPQFALNLASLEIPEGPGTLHPLTAMDRTTLIDWRRRYRVELLGTPPEVALDQATRDIESYIAEDTHRVLMDGDTPLAMTGFNAGLLEIVQIGGVYTPEPLRGRRYARRALALHLAEARANGVRDATLFAVSAAAARAYTALGFRRVGDWTLFMLAEPEVADV